MPDTLSIASKVTTTEPEFQPAAFAAGAAVAETNGGVWSMMTVTVVSVRFPALSTAVPITGWLAPSVGTVTGAGQMAIPDSSSVHVNVTVTGVRFHPAAFGAGDTAPDIVGLIVSMSRICRTKERGL